MMTTSSASLAVDARALDALKHQAQHDAPKAVKEAARQFEALFMQELIKSMRQASMESGLLQDGEGSLARDLYDQQLAVQMSGQTGGLSEAIERQLAQQLGNVDAGATYRSTLDVARVKQSGVAVTVPKSITEFVQHHRAAAERVAHESGIPAHFMLGQAGHETGWGKHVIHQADGSLSHNLFGIKAGKGWTGRVAEVTTTEYIGGVARKVKAKFRAYPSWEASFRDYARLIQDNPRYARARTQMHSPRAWAGALQHAGYATDPHYAAKLSRTIERVQQTLQTPSTHLLA